MLESEPTCLGPNDDDHSMQKDTTEIGKAATSGNHQVDGSTTVDSAATKLWAAKCRAFLKWTLTLKGALITIYGLNVIAWGGMLFLLLCNAAPAMCRPDCNSLNSPRRIWIEIDSQILNALFCVTGFGLAPWRVRDMYYWCFWRLGREEGERQRGLDHLAKIHANWFLRYTEPGVLPTTSQDINNTHGPEPDARPTPPWKMDVVVWGNMLNTVFQIGLAACMWAMNRFNRPGWTTGLLVGLACTVVGIAGIVMWLEKRRIKKAKEPPGALLLIPRATQLPTQLPLPSRKTNRDIPMGQRT